MKDAEIEAIREQAQARTRVSCVEMHAHSADKGCLEGSEPDLALIRVCSELLSLRKALKKLIDR